MTSVKSVDNPEAAVLAAAKDMLRRGLVEGTAGNISARRSDGNIVITPSSVDYADMTLDDLVLVDPDGGVLQAEDGRIAVDGDASCTWPATRRSTTSAASSTATRCGRPCSPSRISRFPACIDEFAVYCGGDIRCTEYAASGTPDVGVNAVKAWRAGRRADRQPRPGGGRAPARQGPAHHRTGGAHRPNRLGGKGSRRPGAHSRGSEPQLRRRLQLSARQPDVVMGTGPAWSRECGACASNSSSTWRPRSFPDTPPSAWQDNADLLVPDFFDPDTDKWHIAVQSWVIEVDGLTVVVDTGVGNDRQRPHMPPLDHLNTGFLSALASAGVDRNAVDVVINTHIHSDHVGWNTMLDGDPGRLGADVSQRAIRAARRRLPPLRTRRAGGDATPAHRRKKRPSSAATSSCSPTASHPSPTRASSSNGRTTTRSVHRCDCGPPPGTRRAPPCCGWTRASRRCSSAI